MNQHGSRIDPNDFHGHIPHPPQLNAKPCHGGKINKYNHAFSLYLVTFEWSSWTDGIGGSFPQWNASSERITPFYPDGEWKDSILIGKRKHHLQRPFYSHAICSECFNHIMM